MHSSSALGTELASQFEQTYGYRPGQRERKSWENSIPSVVGELVGAGLGDVQVLIELEAPLSNDKRIDIVLVGSHPDDSRRMSVVVVENKQWSRASPISDSELVTVPQTWQREHIHPANQAWSYRSILTAYVAVLEQADVAALVNLHNADSRQIANIRPAAMNLDREVVSNVPLFGKDERSGLRSFLRSKLGVADAAFHADQLLKSPRRPTTMLMSAVNTCVTRRSIFTLLDEQRLAYDHVLKAVRASKHSDDKEVVLVIGGPGTGKSVIALELLGELSRLRYDTAHATGSRSFTTTLRERLVDDPDIKRTKRYAQSVFRYFNSYRDASRNGLSVLIADEAHRIRKTSSDRRRRSTKPQVDELIAAAQVPVFLLDDYQVVRKGEVGSVELIREAAKRLGHKAPTEIRLRDQFRCGGCPEYLTWLEGMLGLPDATGQIPKSHRWNPVSKFSVHIADSPNEMEEELRSRQDGDSGTARIAAGYCWPWSTELNADGTLKNDVSIGDWHRPWNSRSEKEINGVPPSNLWATDDAGFDQVGCIYTAQGFEYDHAGVIMGPDLVWREGGWQVDAKANEDRQARSAPDFDRLVRNTYRVLASRGMKSVIFYTVDGQTKQHLLDLGVPPLGFSS